MALTRWPFSNFDEAFFAPFFKDPFFTSTVARMMDAPRSAGVFPPVNVFENGEAYLVRAELPGVDKDSLDISVKGEELTLRGERTVDVAEASASYHRRERAGGQFRRTVTLPKAVDADRITATYANGVLEVVLPWVPEAKPRKITIN